MDKDKFPTLSKLDDIIIKIKGNLPSRVDPLDISPLEDVIKSKMPFKVKLYCACSSWRIHDISRGALEECKENRMSSAFILARASMETSAALWFLNEKLQASIETRNISDFDSYLMKLLCGWKHKDSVESHNFPAAINVLTLIDHVDKIIKGYREEYELISEYVHPNYCGVQGLYGKNDTVNIWTDFGSNDYERDKRKFISALYTALKIYEISSDAISKDFQSFVDICIKEASKK